MFAQMWTENDVVERVNVQKVKLKKKTTAHAQANQHSERWYGQSRRFECPLELAVTVANRATVSRSPLTVPLTNSARVTDELFYGFLDGCPIFVALIMADENNMKYIPVFFFTVNESFRLFENCVVLIWILLFTFYTNKIKRPWKKPNNHFNVFLHEFAVSMSRCMSH